MKKIVPIEMERNLKNSNLAIMKGDVQLAKSQFSNKDLVLLKEALTYKSDGYIDDTMVYHPDFREDSDFIYVPNKYFMKRKNSAFSNFELLDMRYDKVYPKSKIVSNIELRDKQKKIMVHLLHAIKNISETGILKASTGIGKTVMMLYLAYRAKRKTLILVHRESLMQQIIDSIEKKGMLDNVRLGIIRGKKIDVKDKDIVIGMIQTALAPRNAKYLEDFGMLLIDETERIASPKFINAFKACPAKFKIGVSATPFRWDGGKEVLKNNLGRIIVDAEVLGVSGSPVHSSVILISHKFKIYNNPGNEPTKVTSYFEDAVNNNIDRYNMLLNISYHFANNPDRKILIMTSRVKNVINLTNIFRTEGYKVVGLHGKAPKSLVEEAKDSKTRIIVANKQYVAVGFDVEDLNTLIFFDYTQGGLVQKVGRIQRKDDGLERIVIDIVDLSSKLSSDINKSKMYQYKSKVKVKGVYYHKWNEISHIVNTTNYKAGDFIDEAKKI